MFARSMRSLSNFLRLTRSLSLTAFETARSLQAAESQRVREDRPSEEEREVAHAFEPSLTNALHKVGSELCESAINFSCMIDGLV